MGSPESTSSVETRMGELSPGTTFAGRYRLERAIGTGGMSVIWEGTHLALDCRVAVKFIDIAEHDVAKGRERFLREARVAAAIRHRNVVDIIDFGTAEDGRPFMVMELLVGRSLASSLDRTPIVSVAESVRILAGVLSGLAAVHDVGIVHRDLKPENVFLVEDADGVYPKVLDFGVSRAMDPRGELRSVLPTMDNVIVGTPQYMSPEQARALRDVDHRADLWSAGVILFELLTGALPFDADAAGDVIVKIATEEPPDFSALRPDLAGTLSAVVERALKRAPEERFQSAREMRDALLAAGESALESAPRRAEPTTLTRAAVAQILDAAGGAFEPDGSGSFELGSEEDWDEDPAEDSEEDPDEDERTWVTQDEPTLDAHPRGRDPRRVLLALVGALVLVPAGSLAAHALLGREPAVPAVKIARSMHGARGAAADADGPYTEVGSVPEGAVSLDPLALAPDGGEHVGAPPTAEGRAGRTRHLAARNGSYGVVLDGPASPPEPATSARLAPASAGATRPPRRRARGLLRDPGF